VPGYDALGASERAEARLRLAVDLQVRSQAGICARGALGQCTEDERATLLGGRHVPPDPATWTAPVPLVLVTSFYAPTGPLPRPAGPAELQIWLDPQDERTLLTSLHVAGAVTVGRRVY
jgi:hypothetical protein